MKTTNEKIIYATTFIEIEGKKTQVKIGVVFKTPNNGLHISLTALPTNGNIFIENLFEQQVKYLEENKLNII